MEGLCDSFDELLDDADQKRPTCLKCRRPERVCWCLWLPETPVEISGKVIVLQHPHEEKRCLKTAPMLEHGLSKGRCLVYRGQKFPNAKHQGLSEIFQDPNCLVLYPGRNSRCLSTIVGDYKNKAYNLIVIDGTWAQAKSMYFHTPALHSMPQVSLPESGPSLYVVRTQPSESCLSTVESVTLALSLLEDKPEISEPLLRPLQALCTFQLKHGAVEHHSKTVLLELGLYQKKVGKRTIKFLKKGGNDVSKYATKKKENDTNK